MKSITIHGLDDPLDSLIRERAKLEGLSLNKTIKKLLAKTLGLKNEGQIAMEDEFCDLCGVWSDDDVKEFNHNTLELKKIDPEDWQ